jgi:hypothetical protein
MTYLQTHAREAGGFSCRRFRVVVDQNARVSTHDFFTLRSARRYPDDAASEYGASPTLATVFNRAFKAVRPHGTAILRGLT